nr:ATP-dependent Clp protease proteolytic subunit 3, chloroplastic [Ipomoea trifida]
MSFKEISFKLEGKSEEVVIDKPPVDIKASLDHVKQRETRKDCEVDMESAYLTFSTASSTSRNFLNTSCPISQTNPQFLQSRNARTTIGHGCRRRDLSVKAKKQSFSTARQTLSSNWDVFNYTAAPAKLPRFEELDTTNMLLRQRIVFLGSQVDDATADLIISQLLLLDAEDSTKDIKLFINSPGGSVTAGMGIYDAMKQCKADVSTICLGLAASMGAFLLATGSKGKRYIMPNARVMIHQPLGSAGGSEEVAPSPA